MSSPDPRISAHQTVRSGGAKPSQRRPGSAGNRNSRFRWWIRAALLIAAIVLFNLAAAKGLSELAETGLVAGLKAGGWMGIGALCIYAVLLAIPFVPGVEIGISVMIVQGPQMAPFVHGATVAGLCLAYGAGVAFSTSLPCAFLRTLGLAKAGAYVDAMKELGRNDRLQQMKDAVPFKGGRWILEYRYLLLAVLINMPGNSLIGGGGGILLLAGMSRLFWFPGLLLTVILATAPVPLAFWMFGPGLLD